MGMPIAKGPLRTQRDELVRLGRERIEALGRLMGVVGQELGDHHCLLCSCSWLWRVLTRGAENCRRGEAANLWAAVMGGGWGEVE